MSVQVAVLRILYQGQSTPCFCQCVSARKEGLGGSRDLVLLLCNSTHHGMLDTGGGGGACGTRLALAASQWPFPPAGTLLLLPNLSM